jgi:nicotinamide-nucleotide amidase
MNRSCAEAVFPQGAAPVSFCLCLFVGELRSIPYLCWKDSETMDDIIEQLASRLEARGYTLATAESCTGGRIAAAITAWPGCSSFYKGGVVAYSNEVKMNLLHVCRETLDSFGAVSAQTVREMVAGAMAAIGADCAVATSGIAGPGGGSPEKPVGTIWMAAAVRGKEPLVFCQSGDEGRESNACRAAKRALELLLQALDAQK